MGEPFPAFIALVGFFAGVEAGVFGEVVLVFEAFVAGLAFVGAFSGVFMGRGYFWGWRKIFFFGNFLV